VTGVLLVPDLALEGWPGMDRHANELAARLSGVTVPAEAGAIGIPVVASLVASLPEVVEDGVTGLLVTPGDPAALRNAVGALLRDPAQRERLGRAAQHRVSDRFTWDRAAEVALAAYCRAPGGGR
jgi:starch synthase